MSRFNIKVCAYCYLALPAGGSKCGKCQKRVYCSRECQKLDWKTGHKRWCCESGEKDYDYCISQSPGKGLGVFAMRDIKTGEKIIVERPILKGETADVVLHNLDDIPASARDAVIALEPDGASVAEKISLNMMACTDDDEEDEHISGLFINMSRVNHCCIGNSDHEYVQQFGVKILVASRDVLKGEEIAFSYVHPVSEIFPIRHALLQSKWSFDCGCEACCDKGVGDKLNRYKQLDGEIMRLASLGQAEMALRKGRALIAIYDDLRMSAKLYQRTYYDMFQAAIVHPRTSQQGAGLARKALFYATLFRGADHKTVEKYKALADNPTTHRNYHCLI